jgi:phage shock protein C
MTRRLVRDRTRAILGGVAAGFGRYLDVDPVVIRLAFVFLVFADGVGLLAYVVCWLVMPAGDALEPAAVPAAGADFLTAPDLPGEGGSQPAAHDPRTAEPLPARAAVGFTLVALGSTLLAHNLGWFHWPHWLSFHTLWPLLLVAVGVGMIARSRLPLR